MLAVVLGAIRARRAQAATLFLLTALAVAAATAAPWYVVSAARSVAIADVTGAPAVQRVVLATARVESAPDADARVRAEAGRLVGIRGASGTASVRVSGELAHEGVKQGATVAFRDEMCGHLTLAGSCPAAAGEALVSDRTATQLGLAAGDRVAFTVLGKRPVELRVTGTYRLRDPLGPYWAGSVLGRASGTDTAAGAGDPVFTTAETVGRAGAAELFAEYHVVVPVEAYLGIDGYDLAAEIDRQQGGAGSQWRVESRAPALVDRVEREQWLVNLGVSVAAAQLLLLCWFALFFAVRHSAEQRRPDVGWLKLRGGASWRVWALVFQQSVLPMLAGAVAGAAAGLGLARLLGGVDPDRAGQAASLSLAAGAAAVLGALAAAAVADRGGMRAGVIDLLRHVPARRRGWRADVIDLVVVVVAVAGVYQAYATDREPGESTGLVLVAPALVALAVALAAARAIGPLAVRVGHRALRAGRLPLALAATHLARRPGTHRVFALLAVSVALLGAAASGWSAAATAREKRATHDIGADRVLTVQARSRAHLLAAVRAADPAGTQAAAVVRNGTGEAGQVVLAVDTERFARVASWQEGYGPPLPDLLLRLRPGAPPEVRLGDGALVLDAELVGPGEPVRALLHLVTAGGAPLTVNFGQLAVGRSAYQMDLSGCGGRCRLAALELASLAAGGEPPAAREVRIHALTSGGAPVAGLLDASRWRGPARFDARGPTVAAAGGVLELTTPPAASARGTARTGLVHLVDSPVPLPVAHTRFASAGGAPGDPRLSLFGGDEVPVRFSRAVTALPRVPGRGFLVDLEYADRLAADPGLGDEAQVWLAPGAPDAIADRLREQGLGVLADDSIGSAQGRYAEQGPPLALRFQLLAGALGVLLAALALAVAAAVERPDRSTELSALRAQGLSRRAVRLIGHGGYTVLVLAAVAIGTAAAALGGALVEAAMPVFVDEWAVLPVSTGPQMPALLAAGLGGLVVLGVTGALAAAQLVRASGLGPAASTPRSAGAKVLVGAGGRR
ncbi:FtsX-like permease family protein [Phytohabitans sp. ZYX-F-186]|uniref:FtsX-like permease family protein n=1 Tax=Phytohabitans maris TaxID=3071409 RepID=A0ABU0ZSA3_9ACTN|nr:FtsX-like permease family protein [Phytohabitans sp. ZYX-F-186]MDQ7909848.1 FtsX-like permease family protein [Phytohabitans sp. ZYX-F-186]